MNFEGHFTAFSYNFTPQKTAFSVLWRAAETINTPNRIIKTNPLQLYELQRACGARNRDRTGTDCSIGV